MKTGSTAAELLHADRGKTSTVQSVITLLSQFFVANTQKTPCEVVVEKRRFF
jgi:hypothetical protein